ncbi:cysteine proteinase [Auriscalpium vulgare]|uniref:Cysteine proteinase n=1 Tax=Auriscalpium vulgare TaxID=40419 RepID=A0ACB8RYC9_9AGAM|nr:cysteine proteinase [Auriscalpium vulgare]
MFDHSGGEDVVAVQEEIMEVSTKAEHGRQLDNAFRLYLKAANAFLALSRATSDARQQAQWRKETAKALERAEKIKAVKSDLTPVMKDRFSDDEQSLILQRNSILNGVAIPPWNKASESSGDEAVWPWEDPDGLLKLSPEQADASVVWLRPAEAYTKPSMFSRYLEAYHLVQRVVADCSLCASIVVCLLHSRKFDSEDALPSLYPCDPQGQVVASPNGKYELRALLNGTERRVPIDDRLPFHRDGTLMCMSSQMDTDVWPALVEKAYLKVMGGYDFPGSNSTIDIHALAGWIPEYIEVKNPKFQREQTWLRLLTGFTNGRCILTLGTDERPSIQWGERHLLSAHCYAVTHVKEDADGSRWLTVLDSWLPKVDAALEEGLSFAQLSVNGQRDFDMSWDDVCSVFGSICMSWNPTMFENQKVFHGAWRTSNLPNLEKDDPAHQTLRLQFSSPADGAGQQPRDVWVLLSRHRTDTHRAGEYISLQAEFRDDAADEPKRFSEAVKTQGVFTDSPHVLVRTPRVGHRYIRTSVPDTKSSLSLSLIASYSGASSDIGFTLTAYSSLPLAWDTSVRRLPFDASVSGTLTAKSSGGNFTLPTYMNNPQYRLRVLPAATGGRGVGPGPKARVAMRVTAAREVPVNATAVWGKGERVFDLTQKEIAMSSGVYGYGYASAEKDLTPGDYTVVVSAFEPSHQGAFRLHVESSHRLQLEAIPPEGAGMFTKIVTGEWNGASSSGPRYELSVSTASQIKIRLQLLEPKSSFTNVSIFSASSSAQLGKPVVSSGPYTDALSGAVTNLTSLRPGKYVVVPSVYDDKGEGGFRLVVYSSNAGTQIVLPASV